MRNQVLYHHTTKDPMTTNGQLSVTILGSRDWIMRTAVLILLFIIFHLQASFNSKQKEK